MLLVVHFAEVTESKDAFFSRFKKSSSWVVFDQFGSLFVDEFFQSVLVFFPILINRLKCNHCLVVGFFLQY